MQTHLQTSLGRLQRRAAQLADGHYLNIAALLGDPTKDAKAFRGEVWGIVAPSGGGKTAWMVQLAVYAAASLGMRSLYISPEVADYIVHRRALQMIERASKNHVMTRAEELYAKHHAILSKIVVHMEPTNHRTMPQLLADQAAATGARFDILIIDHMKLMDWSAGDLRTEMEAFCGFIKRFAEENQLLVWLVNQVPKSAMSKYGSGASRPLDITDVSEASGIYQIMDAGIVINTPKGPNYSDRLLSIGKGRDLDASAFQDIPFTQNPVYFAFEHRAYAAPKPVAPLPDKLVNLPF